MDREFIATTDLVMGYSEKLNKYSGLFIATILDRERPRYSIGRKWKTHLRDTVIRLPKKRRQALGLIAAFELGRRAVDAERNMRNRTLPLRSAWDVFALLKPEADKQEREVFWCLLLDMRKRLIANPAVVSAGTKDAALVIPRNVFRPAIREGAVAVIAAHNHLSEDVSPSDEDIELTRMLEETGNAAR